MLKWEIQVCDFMFILNIKLNKMFDFRKGEIQKSGGNIMNLLLKQNNKAYCSSRFENHRFSTT